MTSAPAVSMVVGMNIARHRFEYTLSVQVLQSDGTKLVDLPLVVQYESSGGATSKEGMFLDLAMTPASRTKVEAIAMLVQALQVEELPSRPVLPETPPESEFVLEVKP